MEKTYLTKSELKPKIVNFILLAILLLANIGISYSQEIVKFTPRTSTVIPSPAPTIYSVKGDFTMMGNTNLTLVTYGNSTNNNNDMRYVDIDGDDDTWNSSSSTLTFSNENGADQNCSNIIYAGLYWTGRAFTVSETATNEFEVTKNGETKTFNTNKAKLKGPNSTSYTELTADEIYFPTSQHGKMYSAYSEITEYVQQNGIGEYFVADLALREGSTDDIGYYGGWGMVVVYENSKMNYRDVTVFDGHAYVQIGSPTNPRIETLDINGFNAVQNGDVNLKLGLMSGEGDVGVSGDYFHILIPDNDDDPNNVSTLNNNLYQPLSHSTNSATNFFDSSINTGGNLRNPNLQNNTGLDIAMFDIDNSIIEVIKNNQTYTRFRYGSTRDTYIIFNVTFSVDAYVPEPEGILTTTEVNGNTNPGTLEIIPGENVSYKIELKNTGTEAIDKTIITLPIPTSVDASSLSVSSNTYAPLTTTTLPEYKTGPGFGPNGSIVWEIGNLPKPNDPDTVLADITFKLTATQDCDILKSTVFENNPTISLSGTISGTGATSGTSFSTNLIRGYETSGPCKGEPIPAPNIIDINYRDYVDEAPTATPPAAITVQCNQNVPQADITTVTNLADNSGILPTVTHLSDISDNGSNPEIITRTYSVTDDCDNVTNVTQLITIQDSTAPTAPTLADLTGQCSVTATAPTTTDNCAGTITATTNAPLTYNNQGTYTITWNFDDGNGNSINVNQTVIVDDTTEPTAPTLSDLIGQCSVTATAPTTTDNCAGTITATTNDPLTYNSQGTYTITWNFDDGNGNSINVNQTVIVDDTTEPTAPTLSDLTGQCLVTATAPTTTDNCAGTITATTNDPLTYNNQGTYTITWNFDDGNGNSINVNQTVIVDDTTEPTAPTLSDLTGQCSVTATAPTTTDNCAGTITATTNDPLTYNNQGTYTITWNFDDGNGNSINVNQTVIVDDTTEPTAPTLSDLTGQCLVTATAPTTTDGCSGNVITGTTSDPLTYNNQGTYTITWNFDDGNGNSTDAIQTVIVNDTTAPTEPTLADLTGECTVTATAPTTTDNCSGTITATTNDPLTYNNQGTYTITWNFDDGNGNSVNVNQTVIVNDTTAPAAPTLSDLTGECTVTATAPTTTDNCSGTITATTNDPLTYNNQGTYTITWNFDDGNGNSVNVNQTVIVNDTTAPAAPTLSDLTGECTVTATAPTTTDNCSGTITATTNDPLTYNNQGTYTITWNFDDGNGNSVNVNQTVIVNDTTAPAAPTLSDLTGECTVTATAPTTTDNCSGTITATTNDPLTYNNQGTYTITWNFDDGNGNSVNVNQTVIVNDTTAPAAPTLSDLTGECTVTATAPTTTDNCSGTITATTNDPLTYNNQGTYTITWNFDDGNGNSINVNQTVIVNDTTAPAAPTLSDLTGECTVTATAPTTTDNCSGTITATTNDPLTYNNQGTYTITWNFDDGNGNSINVNQTVIVNDTTAPAEPTLADLTGECSVTATAPTTTDNCSGTITATTNDPLTYNNQGTYTITWNFDDGNGNSVNVNQTVIVNDTTAPAEPTLTDLTGQCSVTASAPTTTDNCSGTITATTNDPLTYNNQGTYTITWNFDDGNGNSVNVNQTVIVEDTELPIISCPNNVTVNVDVANCSSSNVDLGLPTATDNCNIDTITNDSPNSYPIGDTTVTWTVTDEAGNSATCTQTVTVVDNIAPSITCPINVFVNTDADLCTASNVNLGTPTTSDCVETTVSNNAPAIFPLGDTTVIWTVTDDSGNSATCEQTVTVSDEQLPTITCPENITTTADAGLCTASNVNLNTPITNDNCSIASVTNDATEPFAIGNTTVTWTVTDGSGNSATCQQIVTVTDNELPTISCPSDITISTDLGSCTASNVNLGNPITDDNCTVASITNDAAEPFTIGNTIVTWTVTDGSGNSATCQQIVTVTDNELPTIVCPTNVTVSADTGLCTASGVNLDVPTSNDNCTVASVTNDSVEPFALGDTIVTWTVTDGSGNSATCEQTVTVTDNELPTIICPPDITVNADSGLCSASNVALGDATGSDNCSVASIINNALEPFPLGDTTVTWTITDGSGNTATCEQTVTVIDGDLPEIVCPDNLTVNTDLGSCTATNIDLGNLDAEDCTSITITNDAPSTFNIGETIVNWTITDEAGNETNCEQTITVIDNELPTITCPSNISVSTDAGLCTASAVDLETPITNDNCSIASITNDAVQPFAIGDTTVTWTIIDTSGNSATCEQIVTVVDTELPTITCPENLTITADPNTCSASNVDLGEAIGNDNCTVDSITNNALEPFAIGETVITWTITDGSGNIATCQQTVTVIDQSLPEITCLEDITVNVDPGTCGATNVDLGTLAAEDCTTITIINDAPSTFEVGETIVTWTITDEAGNETNCEQTITVIDNELPTITCPSNISVSTDTGLCTASAVDLETPTTNDNCSIASITNDAVQPFAIGDTTVTWTVIDGSGNTVTCEQIVTVVDTELPTITCPENLTITADPNTCSASNVDLGEAITNDNCTVESVTNNAVEPFAIGETVITWTITDGSGNIATCQQTVTVIDQSLPEIICPENVTVNVDSNTCGATNVDIGNLEAEDCTNLTITNNAPVTFNVGETIVTWTITDEAGNETNCEQTITVIDNLAPEFVETLPTSTTVECDNIPDAETLTAIDNCGDAQVTFEEVRINGNCESNYALERTWTATDSSNLTTIHTQTITVEDTTAPEFTSTLPLDITVECDNIPDAEDITASDNCNTATVTVVDVKIDGDCDSSYVIERTYTATDECGLAISHMQQITVQDTTAPEPTTTFEAGITVSCTDIPEIPNLDFVDNCSSSVTVDFNETNSFNENTPTDYEIVRTWTVKDDCGNEKDYVQTLTVILDEVVIQVTAPEKCFDDGLIDLNEYVTVENLSGVWELLEGDTNAELNNNIFNPSTLELAEDFLPGEGTKDYLFSYTTTDNGCISVTEISLSINADCVVLPCGQNDIEISTALTPNGDGINESFDIMGIDLCGFTANVKIFNRWGALIYEDDAYTLGEKQGTWKGSAHKSSIGTADKVPNGTYYYIIVLKNSGLEPFTGPLYLGTK